MCERGTLHGLLLSGNIKERPVFHEPACRGTAPPLRGSCSRQPRRFPAVTVGVAVIGTCRLATATAVRPSVAARRPPKDLLLPPPASPSPSPAGPASPHPGNQQQRRAVGCVACGHDRAPGVVPCRPRGRGRRPVALARPRKPTQPVEGRGRDDRESLTGRIALSARFRRACPAPPAILFLSSGRASCSSSCSLCLVSVAYVLAALRSPAPQPASRILIGLPTASSGRKKLSHSLSLYLHLHQVVSYHFVSKRKLPPVLISSTTCWIAYYSY